MRSTIALAIKHIFVSMLCYISVTFSHAATYISAEIGGGSSGSAIPASDGYDVSSRSRDIGGTADQFHFAHETRTGDFDIQTRIDGITITDAFVHGGLMARETLDPGSRFAAVFSSSALLSCFFESRATAATASQQVAPVTGFPANYPQTYLRLRRSGNVFTGFASFDGNAWQQLGGATVALPAQVFFGLAVSSLNTNALSTARFRDIKNVSNPGSLAYKPVETLGPSNRRTGLVFSEIMYNPAPRTDTNNLEFIELFNAESVFIDLTGWRITGGVEYEFPVGFRMEPGQFVVISADPGAIARVYGLSGALGPFRGRLNNGGDSLKLLNRSGATRLEVEYDRKAPWPVAADGTGHSLVLSRPSYGEDDPRAWSASDKVGGSPGELDARWPNPWRSVVINEFLAHTDDPQQDFVELFNASNESVDLSGCVITDDIRTNRFRIPAGTILQARGFISFNQTDLGFSLSSEGETVYLSSPAGDRVIDVIRFDGQENGVSSGRSPDGSPRMTRLASPTPGGSNSGRRLEDIVINEVMYHPITGEEADVYVEIYNRSKAAVDLSGWRFVDGIDFDFPEGAKLSAGSYLVVAKNAAHLISTYLQLNTNNTLGNFDGELSRSGERLALAKRDFAAVTNEFGALVTNVIYLTVSELRYFDGGRWPELADGGGSSLELTDARGDTTLAPNWAASDESSKAPWATVEVNGRIDLGSGSYAANRLQVLMQGAGECLVDDIELIPAGSTNILINGNFDTATNTWRLFGNHSRSTIEPAAAFSGQNWLHVRAPGDGDTANNAIRGQLARSLPTSGTAILRAKVRWLAGWPEVLFRVRGNWIELPARMEVPKTLGTPGQPNSRRVNNSGPAIYDVSHSPALPRANEAVVVTCRVSDPDGVASPRVLFRVEPNQALTTVVMRDDGTGGDALAGDGLFSGTMPGRAGGTLVAFRVEATDDASQSASSVFPSDAPVRECLVRWDDTIPFGTMVHYHMWSTAATESARGANSDLDNTFRDATLVYGNARVIYNAGFRDKGSPYHNGGGDFAVTVGKDDLLLGIDDRIFASTGNGGNEGTNMKGDLAGWLQEQLGIPFLHSHYMRVYRNGSRIRDVMYDMEQPNRYYAKSWFGSGGVKDDLFKIAIWFEFDDNNSAFNSTGATLQRFISDGQYKLARYRWNWQIRPSTETANDYSSIFNLANAANSTTDRTRVLPLLADMEEWMRVFGYHRITGNWDSWSYNVGQNMFLYAPLGQRSALIPWDIDFVLGEGDGATAATLFTAGTDSTVQQLFGLPMYRRMLWRAYQDAANGPLLAANFQPQIDARRAALTKNGVTFGATTSIGTYMTARRNYILGQIRNVDAPLFSITSNGGADFTSTDSSVLLNGTAPLAVASIEVNGVPFPINWTGLTNWQISVPLGGQVNNLEVVGLNLRGNVATGAVDTITIQYSGAVPQPQDWVAINEINYNALAPDADYLELYNRHPSFAFDLSGFRLEGVDYTFPSGTFIQPNGYLVLVENKAAFAAAFDPLLAVLGPWGGNLQQNGETVRLVKPGATEDQDIIVDELRYSNAAPWPAQADGLGPTLQLIDPAQDNTRAGNWMATATNDVNRATPGRQNAARLLLEPFPELWINEVQPINLAGIQDNSSEREPWIELYNGETSSLDLSGLYLSDDPAQLGKWQFPAGTRVAAGQFLLVWADGETAESTVAALHTNFRLGSTNGLILLSRVQGGSPAVVDYVNYQVTTSDNTFGSFPDGDPRRRRMLFVPTPGAANNATIPNANIVINEWMAASHAIIRDPADGQFEDWFELYNAGTNTVDLSGYYLSDIQNDKTQFQIPAGYRIGPGEYRLIWADGEAQQNGVGRDLHVNFSLRSDGEEIALFTPDEQLVTAVAFGPQTANISEGHFPDGSDSAPVFFSTPTPGAANIAQFANRPPEIAPVPDRSVDEGQTLALKVVATDADQPAQTLTYTLLNPPVGATINPQTGDFSWTPTEAHGPGEYSVTVRVTDNGTPERSSTRTFKVTVLEVNISPSINPIADITTDEGVPLAVMIGAADPDLPGQQLVFSLGNGAPAGAAIDPTSGEFQWTPGESQGPGNYSITVQVSDNGLPPASASRSFNVSVRDVNNPPVIDSIPIQTVDEGSLFSLRIPARDPEIPPAKLTFSIENAPAGAQIDADSGFLTWTPDEAAGPRDYNIEVRVSEPGGAPSTTASFLLGVREVNTTPAFDPIPDVIAKPGDSVVINSHATDADLPAQVLTFSALGDLPAGATLSPVTGVFSWTVPLDPPVGTNRVILRVADDATPSLSVERSLNIIIRAPLRVAINEIMHRPARAGAEFVELANYSAVSVADLSGWRLEGFDFTLPAGTVLAPGAFLAVARDATACRAAYGNQGTILGNAVVSLSADGGLLRLVKPGGVGLPDEIIDEVAFSLRAPWPAPAATQGASLQLIDPWEDHRRVSNWSASAGTATNPPVSLLPITANWKYWQNETFPGATWHGSAFNDSAWPSGGALLYVEGAALPAPKTTALTLGQPVYYFRTHFTFNGNTNGALLRFNIVLDDGAVFYLNGQEVFRQRMPEGPVDETTFATSPAVGDAVSEGPLDYPAIGLKEGDNLLAVEAHQVNSTSSDIVFGAAVDVITSTPVSFTPGAPNSVARDLDSLASLWINEIAPNNTAGLADSAGEFDPWIELYNNSDAAVLLNGWSLTDDLNTLTKWVFPDNTSIPARGYLVVFADTETAEASPGQPHANFRLRPDAGTVALSARQNGQPSIVDYVNYGGIAANQSFGPLSDGNPLNRIVLASPSPGAQNTVGSSPGETPKVNFLLMDSRTIRISWLTTTGRSYQIQTTGDLRAAQWSTAAELHGTGSEANFTDGLGQGVSIRFYRVVLLP